jgi:hypothetical protein
MLGSRFGTAGEPDGATLAFAGAAADTFGSTGDFAAVDGTMLAPPEGARLGTAGMPSAEGDDTPGVGLGAESICCPWLYAFEKKLPMAPKMFGTAGFAAGA